MDKYQEIRTILTGRVAYSNGAYVAAESLLKMNYQGTYNGSSAARIFGISCRSNLYQADSMDAAAFTTRKIFEVLGRPVLLRSAPEVPACMLRQLLANPVILTLEQENEKLIVSAYTARTVLSFLSLSRAIRRFEKQLPEGMRTDFREDVSVEKQKRETRKERKARKKAEKWTKKAEKAAEKAAKVQAGMQPNSQVYQERSEDEKDR